MASATPITGEKAVAVPKEPAAPAGGSAPPLPKIGPQDSNVRLLIEKGASTGRYVYTVVDRATDRVIARIPSDEISQLAQTGAYSAGSVIKTKA